MPGIAGGKAKAKKLAEDGRNLYSQRMDTSLKRLEEALSIRRQIGTLEKRLASILESSVPNRLTLTVRRGM